MGTIYRRRRHISTSIRGLAALTDHQLEEYAPYMKVDGQPMRTASEVRKMLEEAMAEGLEFIPAEGCDHFDAKGCCLGHDITPEESNG